MHCPVCLNHSVEKGKRMDYEVMRDKYRRLIKYWCPICMVSFGVQVNKDNEFIREHKFQPRFEEYYV